MKTASNYAAILACWLTTTNVVWGQVTAEASVAAAVGSSERSLGEANYFNSLTTINGQDAYSRYVQNAVSSTESYFRIKQINQGFQEGFRPPRLTYEQYVVMAKRYAPPGLNEQQYDRTLGRLNWPAVLTGEEFSAERDALNQAFMVRSALEAGPASAFYSNVRRIVDSMDAKLKMKFSDLDSTEYITAKNFLIGLTMESRQPLVVRALAAQ